MKKIEPEKPSKVVIIHHPPVHDSKETAAPSEEGASAGESVQDAAPEKPAEGTPLVKEKE